MNASSLFPRPAFVPEFADFSAFRGGTVGLTGQRGVLGGLLAERFGEAGIDCQAFPGDVTDGPALAAWFATRRLRRFFHFAARVPVTEVEADPLRAYEINVIGTFNVCRQLALTQSECWLFHCSSSHVYGPTAAATPIAEDTPPAPQGFYGTTKQAAEDVVRTVCGKLQRPHCIGRVFSYTHVRQRPPYLVPTLQQRIAALRDGDVLAIDNPSAVRDIQDAGTIVDAILWLAARSARGTVNVGGGAGLSVRDIAARVARALGRTITVTGDDRGAPGSLVADTGRLRAALGGGARP